MARQPSVDQIDQLIKDLEQTEQRSMMPEVKQQASRLLASARGFRQELAEYRRVTP